MPVSKINIYKVFGLIVESEFAFSELEQSSGNADVFIRTDEIPAEKKSALPSNNHFYLQVSDVADYLVLNGSEIIVEKKTGTDERVVRLHLLGTVFGILIHQRGFLPVHGSAVTSGSFAIILSGEPGSGKSTLANGFLKNGYSILADDVSVVSLENGHAIVHPAYPQMKLWKNTAEFFGMVANPLNKIHQDTDKYSFHVGSQYYNKPLALRFVFILEKNSGSSPVFTLLKGVEKFDALMKNIYRLNFINNMNIQEPSFKMLGSVAVLTEVFSVKRPDDLNQLDDIVKHIISITET